MKIKKIATRFVLLGELLAMLGAVSLAQTVPHPAGHWQGKIQIPEHETGITVDLDRSANGMWIGSISVLGSSSINVPITNITVEDTAVRFSASLPEKASFDARLSADGSGLSGTATNTAGSAPFQLTRNGEANVRVPPPSSALSADFAGSWEGTLEANGKVRRIGLKLSATADGTATATLIAMDKGNLEIPVSTVTIRDKQLDMESRAVSGAYHGTLGVDGTIVGEWVEAANRLPVIFKRVPPEAKKP